MRHRTRCLSLFLGMLLCASLGFADEKAKASAASEAKVLGKEFPADAKIPFPYLYYAPEHLPAGQRLPLVLYLHGGGERGAKLDLLRRHGPPLLLALGALPRPKDFLLIAPQCQESCRGWPPADLMKFVDGVLARHPIDGARMTVTGQSMGGIATIALLGEYPERFAGGVALCGRGSVRLAQRLLKTPLWLWHGAKDFVIPVAGSRELKAQIEALGGKLVRYDELAGEGHMIHNEVYARAAVWDWLTSQRLAAK